MMIGNDRVAISIAIAAPSCAGQWTRQLQEPRKMTWVQELLAFREDAIDKQAGGGLWTRP